MNTYLRKRESNPWSVGKRMRIKSNNDALCRVFESVYISRSLLYALAAQIEYKLSGNDIFQECIEEELCQKN